MAIVSKENIQKIDNYIKLLETFCAYSINGTVRTFDSVCDKPNLILKWRWKTATDIYQKAYYSLDGASISEGVYKILKLSGYFEKPISNDDMNGKVIDKNGKIIQPILDIDRQICEHLCTDLAMSNSEECTGDYFIFTEKQRFAAITELNKPLKYIR